MAGMIMAVLAGTFMFNLWLSKRTEPHSIPGCREGQSRRGGQSPVRLQAVGADRAGSKFKQAMLAAKLLGVMLYFLVLAFVLAIAPGFASVGVLMTSAWPGRPPGSPAFMEAPGFASVGVLMTSAWPGRPPGSPASMEAPEFVSQGPGKSTLAFALLRSDEVQAAFEGGLCWVSVEQTPDLRLLLGSLVTQLASTASGGPASATALTELQETVVEEPKADGKRVLCVFDDVWDTADVRQLEKTIADETIALRAQLEEMEERYRKATTQLEEISESQIKVRRDAPGCVDGMAKYASLLFMSAVKLLESIGQGRSAHVMIPIAELADLYSSERMEEEAIALYKQAYSIEKDVSGPTSPKLAMHLQKLGMSYQKQGKMEAATLTLEEAASVLENVYGPKHADAVRLREYIQQLMGRHPCQWTVALCDLASRWHRRCTMCRRPSAHMARASQARQARRKERRRRRLLQPRRRRMPAATPTKLNLSHRRSSVHSSCSNSRPSACARVSRRGSAGWLRKGKTCCWGQRPPCRLHRRQVTRLRWLRRSARSSASGWPSALSMRRRPTALRRTARCSRRGRAHLVAAPRRPCSKCSTRSTGCSPGGRS